MARIANYFMLIKTLKWDAGLTGFIFQPRVLATPPLAWLLGNEETDEDHL